MVSLPGVMAVLLPFGVVVLPLPYGGTIVPLPLGSVLVLSPFGGSTAPFVPTSPDGPVKTGPGLASAGAANSQTPCTHACTCPNLKPS